MKQLNSFLRYLGIVAILCGCIGCHNRNQANDNEAVLYYSEFPEEFSLKGIGYVFDDELMRYPYRIRRQGDRLYLLDLHGADYFCHVFHTETSRLVSSFAKRGEGPQETLQALNLWVRSADSIWVYDTNKRELSHWGVPADDTVAIWNGSVKVVDNQLMSANCARCSDSTFFLTDKTGVNRVVKCNNSGEIIERIGEIPASQKVEENALAALAEAWNGYIDYNPDNGILVVVTQLGDVIEIYNLDKKQSRILYGSYGEPEYKVTREGWAVPTGIMGYSDVQVTDNYIYTVFQGTSFKEIMKDPYGTPDGGEYMHIYDLEGNPVCRFLLDHAVCGIHVDEEQGVIWATDVNTEEQVVEYQLPEKFRKRSAR